MLTALLTTATLAAPLAGLEYRPLGRTDLDAVERQLTSGVGVGEFDGVVRPPLQAFAGAMLGKRGALTGSLGVARLQSTTQVSSVTTIRHYGVIRPSIDGRVFFTEPKKGPPALFLIAGMHVDVPSSRDLSNGYDEEEQENADLAAADQRIRLSGIGGRAGLGADLRIHDYVSVGAMYTLLIQRSLFLGSDPSVLTNLATTEASLVVTLHWPRKADEE